MAAIAAMAGAVFAQTAGAVTVTALPEAAMAVAFISGCSCCYSCCCGYGC